MELWWVVVCVVIERSLCCKRINTTSGPICGPLHELPDGKVYKFLGVPYAEPPVGELRFQPPKPVKPWEDTLEANEFGPLCFQPLRQVIWGVVNDSNGGLELRTIRVHHFPIAEDCLNLNIYTPLEPPPDGSPYPTIVYIHGGSYYMNGGRIYPGEKLASLGAIVVTINYRLGPFGFLSSGTSLIPGNQGLLDQKLALQWIQANAFKFGGHPNLITIMGNSAGGASVMLQMLSPHSKGLFSRVVAMSGCSIAPWALQLNPRPHMLGLAARLGCSTYDDEEVIECLRTKDPVAIIKNVEWSDGLGIAYAAVIDGDFLPDNPLDMIRNGSFSHVPVVMGVTTDEVSIWFVHCHGENPFDNHKCALHDDSFSGYRNGQESPHDRIELFLEHDARSWLEHSANVSAESRKALVHAVKVEYMYKTGFSNPRQMGDTRIISDVISDIGLKAPCVKELQELVQVNEENCYFYEFGYSSNDDVKKENQSWIGAYHESDLQYFFGEPLLNYSNSLRNDLDKTVSEISMKYLINFATNGNPAGNKSKFELHPEWLPYNTEQQVYLYIGNETQLRENYLTERMLFWNSFVRSFIDWPMEEHICESVSWITWLLVTALAIVVAFNAFLFLRTNRNCLWRNEQPTPRPPVSNSKSDPITAV